MMRCPECHSDRVFPSRRRNALERGLLAMLLVRPFRCLACDLRFFRWSVTAHPNASRSAATH